MGEGREDGVVGKLKFMSILCMRHCWGVRGAAYGALGVPEGA